MSFLSHLRGIVNKRLLHPLGQEWTVADRATMRAGLQRARRLGVPVSSFVDIGCAEGHWTTLALQAYPEARALLVDALREWEPRLRKRAEAHPGRIQTHIGALGAVTGTLAFEVTPDLYGSGHDAGMNDPASERREVPVTTLDHLVRHHALAPPYGLKFDTHGFELPILEGAFQTLADTSLIVMEAYLFRSAQFPRVFWEMCAWLDARGFACLDLVDLHPRPHDGALWQLDLFFTRKTWPGFQHPHYR